MRTIKYAIAPGYVISKNDGQRHYISADRLMRLYGVPPSECIIITKDNMTARTKDLTGLIILRPDYSGRYNLADVYIESIQFYTYILGGDMACLHDNMHHISLYRSKSQGDLRPWRVIESSACADCGAEIYEFWLTAYKNYLEGAKAMNRDKQCPK